MYYRKQVFFSLFILFILLFVYYKKTTNDVKIDNSEKVIVKVTNSNCSNRLTKNNYSSFEFKYKNQLYEQRVGKSKCAEIASKEKLELFYNAKTNEFLLPEVANRNNYRRYLLILAILLFLGLIPYKFLLK